MPKFDNNSDDMQIATINGMGSMTFSAVKPENLGASEYTVVTLVVDVTGSVDGFENDLKKTVEAVVEACKKSERSENLMFRVVLFNTLIGIEEVHGFKELYSIDVTEYDNFNPNGLTNLYDAVFSSISAELQYSKALIEDDYEVNGAIYILTDGDDNQSKMTASEIKKLIEVSKRTEVIDSLITVLIGMNNPNITGDNYAKITAVKLKEFKEDAGIDEFVDMGDATPQRLAKLVAFVSQSVVSQNSNLGTGQPSKIITPSF